MFLDSQDTENTAVLLPISSRDREIAREFASQVISEKAKTVLLNTLAVLTVKSYLEMLDFATDLSDCDTFNPVMRACDNVADLDVVGYGKIECRPVINSDGSCPIPMEVWDLRIGFVVVNIDNSLKQAAILGFVKKVNTEELALNQLNPIEALIDRLHEMKQVTVNDNLVNLKQWLQDSFTAGWETVDSLLSPQQLTPAWGFRGGEFLETDSLTNGNTNHRIQRAKLIDLGIQLGDRQVILLIEITPEVEGEIGITLQVHPQPEDVYLPVALTLQVLESSEEVFMQSQARNKDNYIQLQFSGASGECFGVQIVLGHVTFTEQFQL